MITSHLKLISESCNAMICCDDLKYCHSCNAIAERLKLYQGEGICLHTVYTADTTNHWSDEIKSPQSIHQAINHHSDVMAIPWMLSLCLSLSL
jgi:phage terminase large subunit GpA-like protein